MRGLPRPIRRTCPVRVGASRIGTLGFVLPVAALVLAGCQHAGGAPPETLAASAVPTGVTRESEPTGAKPAAAASASIRTETTAQEPRPFGRTGSLPLVDAVASAVYSHPDIRVSEARVREARAGVSISEAGLYPTLEGRIGAGPNLSSTYQGEIGPFAVGPGEADGRLDGSLFLRQLIYDFGATNADIDRARLVMDAERLKLQDKVEDIGYRTALAYMKVLETRALLAVVDETIGAHKRLATIVEANVREGNSTSADLGRVLSRLTDVTAIRSDMSLQALGAEEQFHRLTKLRPNRLAGVPVMRGAIPASAEEAIAEAVQRNPRLGSIASTTKSISREIDFQTASALPKLQLEADGDSKSYASVQNYRNQFEARALVSLRYRFLDGGLQQATVAQLDARRQGSEMSFLNEREQLEADVRQAYRAIASGGTKARLLGEGVRTSATVQELYLEQFKAGRRSVFELLDSQMSYFSSRRAMVESRYEGERAILDILKAMGQLTRTLTGTPRAAVPGVPAPRRPTPKERSA